MADMNTQTLSLRLTLEVNKYICSPSGFIDSLFLNYGLQSCCLFAL